MNTNYFHLSTELIVGFFALLVITKVLGKSQITQITPFDFISAQVLGELVGNAIYDKEITLIYVLFAIGLWGTLIFLVEFLTQKFRRTRGALEGNPVVIIRKGKINYDLLKKNKLDLNQLQHLLRDKDVFSFREVEYAILEANGSVSVMKKDRYTYPSKADFNLKIQSISLPITVISDGEVVIDNLKEAKLSQKTLFDNIFKQGFSDPKQILVAEWSNEDGLYILPY